MTRSTGEQRVRLFVYVLVSSGFVVASGCSSTRATTVSDPIRNATTADPFAYCAAAGTIDEPSGPFPDVLADALIEMEVISPDAPRELAKHAAWRCLNGEVLACHFGANLPCVERADPGRSPSAPMKDYCRDEPEAETIPAAVTGRATVYTWRCTGGSPAIVEQVFTPDERGFLGELWQTVPHDRSPTSMSAAATELTPVAEPSAKERELADRLDARLEARDDAEAVEQIDADIRARYERTLAVMITDMSGMTKLTRERGILGFLALIREMHQITVPVLRARGATWVKVEADDLFVVHPEAGKLLAAAREMLAAVRRHHEDSGDDSIRIGVGLGFGKVIDLDDNLWGNAVNTASKLGEDTAEPWEILVTEEFYVALTAEGVKDHGCTSVPEDERKAPFPYYTCRSAATWH